MKKILKKLIKFTKLHFYEHATKLLQQAKHHSGKFIEIIDTESYEDVYSNEELIDGKYFYIQKCEINEFTPTYKTKFIKLWPEDKVKRWILDKVTMKLAKEFKEMNLDTFVKNNQFLLKIRLTTYEGEVYEDKESGEDKVNTKLILYNRCIKYLNHVKYERRKKCKK